MNKIKKYWLPIVLTIAVLILLSILFKGCGDVKELQAKNKELNAQVQAKDKALIEKDKVHAKDSAEKQQEVDRMDTVIKEQQQVIAAKEIDIKAKGALVRRLLKEAGEEVPNLSDSVDRLVASKIDSALSEFDQLSLKYGSLEVAMDELIAAQIKKDSTQKEQLDIAYAQLKVVREGYAEIFTKYNILYKDFQKIAKKTKKARFLNKALALGLLGAGVYGVMK